MSSSFDGIYEPGVVDPGLPVHNPTKPFWQSSPHQFAGYRSPWPEAPVDVAIIGSGMTGSNLARSLLKLRPGLRVVLLEARTLCSGATGRNGGHIKTMTYADWGNRKRDLGVDEAIRVTKFEHSHLQAMGDAIRDGNIDCDLVMTDGLDVYYDEKTFAKAVAGLEDMRTYIPEVADKYKICTDLNRLRAEMKLSDRCIGAIIVPSASLWPYKMVLGLLEPIIKDGSLNVQTNTTVLRIEDGPSRSGATIHTTQGIIEARNVVHATNGWLGHLIHELRPHVSPVRGNVVRYDATGNASPFGLNSRYSLWMRYAAKDYDYLIQRSGGDIVVGRANTARRATGDDSKTDLGPMAHLRGMADEVAASPVKGAAAHISHAWSGILAFTQDTSPFVGQLPFPQRQHQWVCGAYHGVGMTKAFRTAEMMAHLILDIPLSDEYPRSMFLSDKRVADLEKSLDQGLPIKAGL